MNSFVIGAGSSGSAITAEIIYAGYPALRAVPYGIDRAGFAAFGTVVKIIGLTATADPRPLRDRSVDGLHTFRDRHDTVIVLRGFENHDERDDEHSDHISEPE